MLASSWKAKGLLQPIWKRIGDVPTYKREELARRVGVAPNDLSSINTGNRVMTMELAAKIMDAVPGVTLLDLGAPAHALQEPDPALCRLQALEDEVSFLREWVGRGFAALGVAPELRDEARRSSDGHAN